MTDPRYLTVEDIETFYTGGSEHPFALHGDLLEVMKTAGATTTATTGVLNKVYGALVWSQLNQEANAWGMLPKTNWVRSGWRVKTDYAIPSTSGDVTIALSETATLPDPVTPTMELVYATPKIQAEPFEVTDIVEALSANSQDDIWGAAHQVRAEIGTEFIKLLNKQLCHQVAEADSSRSTTLQSLDRIVSKAGEQGVTAGYEDIYGLDRSAKSWSQAYVDDSASNRDLTDKLVRNLLMQTRKRGARTNVIMTGYDTYASLLGLYMSFVRYMPMSEAKVQFGVNGVQTAAGMDAGTQIATLYNIPMIQTDDCPAATNGISNIYALDTSDPEGYGFPRLGISVLRPVEYFESRDYVLLNKFSIKGLYRVVAEVTGRFLYGQGKLRDLK